MRDLLSRTLFRARQACRFASLTIGQAVTFSVAAITFSIAAITFSAAGPAIAADCNATSVGLVPLNDLATGSYQGSTGGLYPNGSNTRPTDHQTRGMQQAALVTPRDAIGQPDPTGAIALVTVGMSNTSAESNAFIAAANADPMLNSNLVIVNGAQGGQPASSIDDPDAPYWDVVDDRLAQRGLTPLQVQAVWIKQADAGPSGAFPDYAATLHQELRTIVQIIKARYPNTQLCYLSSRIYAGYATTQLNPEPYAYHSGFSVKWLIEDQINGDAQLNYDPQNGPVEAPWLSWAAYLWADGLDARSDGLIWECDDLANDGTHPSGQGSDKVAGLLMDFFNNDSTAQSWFLGSASNAGPGLPSRTTIEVLPPRPNPFNPRVVLPLRLDQTASITLEILTPAGERVRRIDAGVLSAGNHDLIWNGNDDDGRAVASGVYLMRVQADGQRATTFKAALVR